MRPISSTDPTKRLHTISNMHLDETLRSTFWAFGGYRYRHGNGTLTHALRMCTRAVGRTYKRTLPHTSPKGTAKVFRQALALDESWHGYEYWPWVDTPSGTDQLTRGDSAKTDSISVACELCPTETTEDDTNHEEVWFSGNNWGESSPMW